MSPPVNTPESPEKKALRVKRIKDLIQLASSTGGEATEAALRACALIRKFGLDIVDPTLLDELYAVNHRLTAELEAAKADLSPGLSHTQGAHVFSTASAYFRTQPYYPPSTHYPPSTPQAKTSPAPPPPPFNQPPQAPAGLGAPMKAPVFIAASKFQGRCKHCGADYDVGDSIQWQRGVGAWCGTSSCYADWKAAQAQYANFIP